MDVLVTGATGFVGRTLIDTLLSKGIRVKALVRNASGVFPTLVEQVRGELSDKLNLRGIDVVIHAAARVHVMQDSANDPQSEYDKVNVDGTLNIARQAAEAGVKRFIFISTIKVNGEETYAHPFTADDEPKPQDPYAISKYKAELELLELADNCDMDVVIIRPPLIYGPGVKGNFSSLINAVRRGVPLPLGAINNKRSLVGIDNLIDLIITCIDHPAASNQVFLVSDGCDLSISELLKGLAKAIGKRLLLPAVPESVLTACAGLLGKKDVAQRLFGSLQVDIAKTCQFLSWKPPYTVDDGLKRCCIKDN